MEHFYLIIVVILFLLAISDLVVGVANDAVNFLNSAVGAKAASFKLILAVAALGIIIGCTFSSGMMEVARKGVFNPEHFYFSEIILLFLAVMVADVVLLDAFNTFGLPTSTTVSVVFELLGAAVALSILKIYNDPNALSLGEYINSGKALAIISGILVSVVIAFTAGLVFQYLSRLIFSFDYEKRMKYYGSLWGGLAVSCIVYFMVVKGAKGASFLSNDVVRMFEENALFIIAVSFAGCTLVLQLISWFTKLNILKLIVLLGTFALAMAFAGNDLVNFIGVPLAGYNSYLIYTENGGNLLMGDLAGAVPTPTLLLLLAGIIMTITLWTSKKARSVVKTSLDLGRQYDGAERFASYPFSRTLVRNTSKFAARVNALLPNGFKQFVNRQFDEKPLMEKQSRLGAEAPVFDMIRASVTLVVSSTLIAMGTNLKLPLSTTYVTFMVFMGASLADGAWGRESAVYRISGVLSVVGGWFFTAFSAFLTAFVFAGIFYFGGVVAIALILMLAIYLVYRSHRYHTERMEEQAAYEQALEAEVINKKQVIDLSTIAVEQTLGGIVKVLDEAVQALGQENLDKLIKARKEIKMIRKHTDQHRKLTNKVLERIDDNDVEAVQFYILTADYLDEMAQHTQIIIRSSLEHVDNHHKPLLPGQISGLKSAVKKLRNHLTAIVQSFKQADLAAVRELEGHQQLFLESIRDLRKDQIKLIKQKKVGARSTNLYLSHLAELRNLALFSNRMLKVFDELILDPKAGQSQ